MAGGGARLKGLPRIGGGHSSKQRLLSGAPPLHPLLNACKTSLSHCLSRSLSCTPEAFAEQKQRRQNSARSAWCRCGLGRSVAGTSSQFLIFRRARQQTERRKVWFSQPPVESVCVALPLTFSSRRRRKGAFAHEASPPRDCPSQRSLVRGLGSLSVRRPPKPFRERPFCGFHCEVLRLKVRVKTFQPLQQRVRCRQRAGIHPFAARVQRAPRGDSVSEPSVRLPFLPLSAAKTHSNESLWVCSAFSHSGFLRRECEASALECPTAPAEAEDGRWRHLLCRPLRLR